MTSKLRTIQQRMRELQEELQASADEQREQLREDGRLGKELTAMGSIVLAVCIMLIALFATLKFIWLIIGG